VAEYDRRLLATGSTPFMLPVPGRDLAGVISYRDIHDTNAMIAAAGKHTHAVVIGGGLLGLEAANGLSLPGITVNVVHLAPLPMESHLAATYLRQVAVIDQHGAAGCALAQVDQFKQGAFTGTGMTGHEQHLAGLDGKIDIAQRIMRSGISLAGGIEISAVTGFASLRFSVVVCRRPAVPLAGEQTGNKG